MFRKIKNRNDKRIVAIFIVFSFVFVSVFSSAQNISIPQNFQDFSKEEKIVLLKNLIQQVSERIENLIAERIKMETQHHKKDIVFSEDGLPAGINPEYDYILGSPDAEIFFLIYFDLECPFCKEYHSNVVDPLYEKYKEDGRISFVYRNFPITKPLAKVDLHPSALEEAIALECVGRQLGDEKYYEFISLIFEISKSNGNFPVSTLPDLAQGIGADKEKIKTCLEEESVYTRVETSFNEGVHSNVHGTPTVFIFSDKYGLKRIPGSHLGLVDMNEIIEDFFLESN